MLQQVQAENADHPHSLPNDELIFALVDTDPPSFTSEDDDDAVDDLMMQCAESRVNGVNEYVRNVLALLKAMDARQERIQEVYHQYRLVHDKRWLQVMLRIAEEGSITLDY